MRIVGTPEVARTELRQSAPVAPTERAADTQAAAAQARAAAAPVTTSRVTAGASAPVDHERVALIRKALEENRYPLVPAEIADALIAANLYGIVGQ